MRSSLQYTRFSEANTAVDVHKRSGPHLFNDSPPGNWARAASSLAEVLTPWLCIGCQGRPNGRFFCSECAASFARPAPSVLNALCPRFEQGITQLSALWYTEPKSVAQKTVHAIKYQFCPELAHACGRSLGEKLGALEFDALVPIPLHRTRFAERGFNQARLIATGMSEHVGAPVLDLLKRRVARESQTRVRASERRALAPDTFRVSGEADSLRLLLVDDVTTTGSTLNTAARTLIAAGASWVGGAVLAVPRRPGAP